MDDDSKLEEERDTFVFINPNQQEAQALTQEELKKFRKGNSDINRQEEKDRTVLFLATAMRIDNNSFLTKQNALVNENDIKFSELGRNYFDA